MAGRGRKHARSLQWPYLVVLSALVASGCGRWPIRCCGHERFVCERPPCATTHHAHVPGVRCSCTRSAHTTHHTYTHTKSKFVVLVAGWVCGGERRARGCCVRFRRLCRGGEKSEGVLCKVPTTVGVRREGRRKSRDVVAGGTRATLPHNLAW